MGSTKGNAPSPSWNGIMSPLSVNASSMYESWVESTSCNSASMLVLEIEADGPLGLCRLDEGSDDVVELSCVDVCFLKKLTKLCWPWDFLGVALTGFFPGGPDGTIFCRFAGGPTNGRLLWKLESSLVVPKGAEIAGSYCVDPLIVAKDVPSVFESGWVLRAFFAWRLELGWAATFENMSRIFCLVAYSLDACADSFNFGAVLWGRRFPSTKRPGGFTISRRYCSRSPTIIFSLITP